MIPQWACSTFTPPPTFFFNVMGVNQWFGIPAAVFPCSARLCIGTSKYTHTPPVGCSIPPTTPRLMSAATILGYFFWRGQCHFPLCMWILEIRLSTVIVHRVEPSVIVQPERSQGFHYTGEKVEQIIDRLQEKKTNTRHNMSEHLLYSVYMPYYMSEYGGSESIC